MGLGGGDVGEHGSDNDPGYGGSDSGYGGGGGYGDIGIASIGDQYAGSYRDQALNEMRSAYTHNTYAGHTSLTGQYDRAYSGRSPDAFSAAENASRYAGLQSQYMGQKLPATPQSITAGLLTGLASLIGRPSKMAMMAGNAAVGLPATQSLAKTADLGMRAHNAVEGQWTGSPQSLNQAQRDFGFDPNTRSLPGERPGQVTPRQGITPQAQTSILANRSFQPMQNPKNGIPYNNGYMSMYTRSPLTSVNAFPGSGILPSNYYM